ncbi:MAG: hypothetical protein WAW23_07750 [Candidatus Methanoperedens sp.]
MAILESREERVKLLKSRFTGRDIETLYVILNSFDVVGVNWQEIPTVPVLKEGISREGYVSNNP